MKKIKVGDNVKVILGKNKGQTGKIKTLFHKTGKVIIEGMNTKIKHVKPAKKDEIGKIIQFDAPLHISNVMLCDENGVASRIGITMNDGKKVRILKKTKTLLS
jgi:large subunit ribosomal protein L24